MSSAEARRGSTQHRRPCGDCPWRRDSLKGWVGGLTADQWLRAAHGEDRIDCHTRRGPQCAGAATYRGNVGKLPRDQELLRLAPDREAVFSRPDEFLEHHAVISLHKEKRP